MVSVQCPCGAITTATPLHGPASILGTLDAHDNADGPCSRVGEYVQLAPRTDEDMEHDSAHARRRRRLRR